MRWVNVTARATRSTFEQLENCLWDHGALSVSVRDAGTEPIFEPPPDETPLWETILVTELFPVDFPVDVSGDITTDIAADTRLSRLTCELAAGGFELHCLEQLEDKLWEREWLTRFKPMKFGRRLWVCPTDLEPTPAEHKPNAPGQIIVRLDPGLAFGTGSHETTRLCLEYIDGFDCAGKTVIDYGCGAGVLAIAAALCGAKEVFAVDIDPQAVTATQANAVKNRVKVRTCGACN